MFISVQYFTLQINSLAGPSFSLDEGLLSTICN